MVQDSLNIEVQDYSQVDHHKIRGKYPMQLLMILGRISLMDLSTAKWQVAHPEGFLLAFLELKKFFILNFLNFYSVTQFTLKIKKFYRKLILLVSLFIY